MPFFLTTKHIKGKKKCAAPCDMYLHRHKRALENTHQVIYPIPQYLSSKITHNIWDISY